jgi:hypothetical protein
MLHLFLLHLIPSNFLCLRRQNAFDLSPRRPHTPRLAVFTKMKLTPLEFEKPIVELEKAIAALKAA